MLLESTQNRKDGINFLMIVASRGHDDIVELLLEEGETDLSYRLIDGRFQSQTVLTITRQALNEYENHSVDLLDREDPEHIRIKKIERHNHIIKLFEEAGVTT